MHVLSVYKRIFKRDSNTSEIRVSFAKRQKPPSGYFARLDLCVRSLEIILRVKRYACICRVVAKVHVAKGEGRREAR